MTQYDPIRVEFYIPTVEIEIVNSAAAIIEVNHLPANQDWRYAGSVCQKLAGLNGLQVRTSKNLGFNLDEQRFISLQWGETEVWYLVYIPAKWLKRIRLKLWQYNGTNDFDSNI